MMMKLIILILTFLIDINEKISNFLDTIKVLGRIYYENNHFKFKKCPININENRKYIITGEKGNILTKT